MAVSGLIMLGYLLVHAYGNLKFFQGPEKFDSYLEGLDDILYPYLPHEGALWILRVVLVGALVVHVYAAITLWRRNKVAAGYVGNTRYQTKQNKTGYQRSYASFTMRWGGIILLLFIIGHVAQMLNSSRMMPFIIGHVAQMLPNWLSPGGASDSKYERVVNGFELWWVVLLYTIGLVAVGFHLAHGFWSALTTLGQNHSSTRRSSRITAVSIGLAVLIAGGFLTVPFAIFFFGAGS